MSACSFSGWAMTNDNFKAIITKPDNVPIVMLIFSVGFFTWLALRKAVINDDRSPAASRRWKSSARTKRCWSGPTWSTPS